MSEDSKTSRLKSPHSSRSSLNESRKRGASPHTSSSIESKSWETDSNKIKRRKSADESLRHREPSKTADKEKTRGLPVKSLVKIPSLLSSVALSPAYSGDLRPKVVQLRSGVEKKRWIAKSLMDLQFEDQTSSRNNFFNRHVPDNKPGLLPLPHEAFQANRQMLGAGNFHHNDLSLWSLGKDVKKVRKSWIESEVEPSPTLFNSIYKPLVVESEPLKKERKKSHSPKPLLETPVFPAGSYSCSPNVFRPRSLQFDKPLPHPDRIVCINCNESTAVLIFPSTLPWVHLHGRAKITVLKGTVTILAHTLKPGVGYEVFSPSSHCLLSLQVDPVNFMSPGEVKDTLRDFNFSMQGCEHLSTKTIGLIKVEKFQSVVCDYVTSLGICKKLFTPPSSAETKHTVGVTPFANGFKVAPEEEMNVPCMSWIEKYNTALDKWSETIDNCCKGGHSPVFVSCGPKSSGKSLFNRCAINTTLRSVSEVAFLDCDIGQSEFSPPATLSLHILSKPILSPPFCHQRSPTKMIFYGETDPTQDPSLYIKCIQALIEAYKKLSSRENLPLIVNTMGFTTGLGLMLLIDTMNLLQPDLVAQLELTGSNKNLPDLTPEFVASEEGWTVNKCPAESDEDRLKNAKKHSLVFLTSLNTVKSISEGYKLQGVDLRNLSMLASLSSGLCEGETLWSRTPYTVSYRKMGVFVCGHRILPEEILLALDGMVVALCEADLTQATKHSEELPLVFDQLPVCDCHGLGIVRGIDTDKGLLYITTSLPWQRLRWINAVVKGSLALPNSCLTKQVKRSDFPVPFIDSLEEATATYNLRARRHMPRLNKNLPKLMEK